MLLNKYLGKLYKNFDIQNVLFHIVTIIEIVYFKCKKVTKIFMQLHANFFPNSSIQLDYCA